MSKAAGIHKKIFNKFNPIGIFCSDIVIDRMISFYQYLSELLQIIQIIHITFFLICHHYVYGLIKVRHKNYFVKVKLTT